MNKLLNRHTNEILQSKLASTEHNAKNHPHPFGQVCNLKLAREIREILHARGIKA